MDKGCFETMKDHFVVPCIVVFELCLKVSYYSFELMMFLFLYREMNYSYSTSFGIYHLFVGLGYITVIIFTMASESCMPKFFSIFLLTVNGIIGNVLIVLASTTTSPDGLTKFSEYGHFLLYPGLLLRAFGICATRDLVRAFGAEQFDLPAEKEDLYNLYKLLYFFSTAGAILSYIVVPQIRTNVACYGRYDCFPVAYVVPACLIVIGLVLLAVGSQSYVKLKPQGSVTLQCIKYMFTGDSDEGGLEFVADYYAAREVLPLFIPLPIFWSLLEQTGSRWTYQASRMEGRLFTKSNTPHIEPDQMQILNPIFILLLIPLTDYLVYPLMDKCGLTPLKRHAIGAVLAIMAFVVAALIEMKIEDNYRDVDNTGSNLNPNIQNMTAAIANITNINGTDINATNSYPTVISRNMTSDVHMAWQTPQYLLISLAQFLFPLALIEFTFTQVPLSMKQWLLFWWYLTLALGHFIAMVAGFAGEIFWFSEYALYWTFACLMAFDTVLFIIVAYRYPTKYDDDD